MADTESAKKELIAITPEIFPEFTGKRVPRDLRVKDTDYKLSFNLPIFPTVKENAEFYDVSEEDFVAKAVIKISYDRDTALRKHLTDNGAGIDWDEADGTKEAEIFVADLRKAPARKMSEKVAKAKERDAKLSRTENILAKFGVSSLDELEERLAKAKAKKK